MSREVFTKVEEHLLGGSTWATESMTFLERLRFFRDTGEWPGVHSKAVTEMFMRGNIKAEGADGKSYCADKKSKRAEEAGLKTR